MWMGESYICTIIKSTGKAVVVSMNRSFCAARPVCESWQIHIRDTVMKDPKIAGDKDAKVTVTC